MSPTETTPLRTPERLHRRAAAPRAAAGFTLIESLVALLVLSIGLLGVAAMQLASLQANNGAFQRTQATFLAQDIADRMRANRTAAMAGDYDFDLGDAAPGDIDTIAEADIVAWKDRLAATLGRRRAAQCRDRRGSRHGRRPDHGRVGRLQGRRRPADLRHEDAPVNRQHRQSGFSVVELMASMTISLLLLAGVLSVMYTSRITYDENARVSRLQEYARASVELILRDLRSAGNQGCARPIRPEHFRNALTTPNASRYNFGRPVEGFEGSDGAWAPAMDAAITSPSANSEVLVVRSLVTNLPPFRTSAAFAGGGGSIPIEKPNGNGFPQGTPLMISDCEFANVFANSGAIATAGTTANLLRATTAITAPAGAVQVPRNSAVDFPTYRAGSLVTAVETVVYYIRPSATGRGPALWRLEGNNAPQELVEGVERLEIQYGEDTNDDLLVDVYRDADEVVDWT